MRADTLFSLYLRKKRGYRCEFDNAFFPEGRGLTVSHFWSRGKDSVRFDEENCDILCVSHHAYFEEHKTEYETWKKDRMGEKAFNLLMLRAHTYHKKEAAPILMWLKLERLKNIIRGDHPDSITLTEAAESLEEKGLLPNLLDPNQTTMKANP